MHVGVSNHTAYTCHVNHNGYIHYRSTKYPPKFESTRSDERAVWPRSLRRRLESEQRARVIARIPAVTARDGQAGAPAPRVTIISTSPCSIHYSFAIHITHVYL